VRKKAADGQNSTLVKNRKRNAELPSSPRPHGRVSRSFERYATDEARPVNP